MRVILICLCSLIVLSLTAQAKPPPNSETENNALIQRLERIEQLLQSQGLIDMLQQLESLQQDINSLRGEIELQNHSLEQLKKRQRSLYTDIDQRMQRLSRPADTGPVDITASETMTSSPPLQTLSAVSGSTAAVPAQHTSTPLTIEVVNTEPTQQAQMSNISAAETNSAASANPVTEIPININPAQVRAEYQQAFNLLKQAQYDQAIKAFRQFIVANPGSEFSDNAQYWLGEAHYIIHQYHQAIAEYDKLVTRYPASQKVTHALLKIGYSYYELGQSEQAKRHLQDLRQRYPGTTAARLAEQRLSSMLIPQQSSTDN
ncbi:MAG: tol-pal system protein YbgF [Gammaproteobacteria bacterium]|nr:tol-pal system protein YbgF [Gammaproteobacteria bacterium]